MKKIIAVFILCSFITGNSYAYSGESVWARDTVETAIKYNIVPDSIKSSDISKAATRGQFAALSVSLYEAMSGQSLTSAENPFTNDVDEAVLKAVSGGFISNSISDEFKADSLITREEAAFMLANVYRLYTHEEAYLADKIPFADDASISDYARESVYFIQDKQIIHIVGSNKFAPKNLSEDEIRANYANMTSQQAIISAVRLYEMLKGNNGGENTEKTVGEICRGMIPEIDFGEVSSEKINSDSAAITVSGATSDDYYKYVETAKRSFPEEIYTLEGQNYKAWDREYTINITYLDGVLSVEVFKD